MNLAFERLSDITCRIGEGATWDERAGRLWFVDIAGQTLHAWDSLPAALSSWTFDSVVPSLGLCASGRVVVALRREIILFDPADGGRKVVCTIDLGRDDMRLNDGKVGPDGAFWVGSIHDGRSREPAGALYRVAPDGAVTRVVDGIAASNGLAWSADGATMFHADSRGPWIDRWSFDRQTGALSGRTRIAEPGDDIGRPDGGAVDVEGTYWSAGVSAGRLNRFSPTGRLIESLQAPAASPSMPCFGGADYHTLFLTTISEGKSPEELAASPGSGGLFAAASPVAGFPGWRFLDV